MPVRFGITLDQNHAERSYDPATDTATYLAPPGWSRDEAVGYCSALAEEALKKQVAELKEQVAEAMAMASHPHEGGHVHDTDYAGVEPEPEDKPKGRGRK